MKKITLFKVFTPFVCAAIVLIACPLSAKDNYSSIKQTKENIVSEETTSLPSLPTNLEDAQIALPDRYYLSNNMVFKYDIKNTNSTVEEETTSHENIEEISTEETAPIEEETTIEITEVSTEIIKETTTTIPVTTEETTVYIPPTVEETTTVPPTTEVIITQAPVVVQSVEYPVATYVWNYLRGYGYSPATTAGIIGNMMAECGGWTLNLNYMAYNVRGFYGLCQWSTKYVPTMLNTGLEYQMAFLVSSVPDVLPKNYNNGSKYGFDYGTFINLQDPAYAATIFCREYEQCGNQEVECARRGQFAWVAYNYFMGQ